MLTLPDLLSDDIAILSVGLNPSTPSAHAGFYFANPRNRFWKALNACNAFNEPLEPSLDSCQQLHQQYRIGFTDLVKRPTVGCKDLCAADYREGSQRLYALVHDLKPAVIWFHGKLTCQKYVQYSENKHRPVDWGLQQWGIHHHSVFVTPNPSPANAAFSLETIIKSYQQLFKHAAERSAC